MVVAGLVFVTGLLGLPRGGHGFAVPDHSRVFSQHTTAIRACAADSRGSFAVMIAMSTMGTRIARGHVQRASSAAMSRAGACLLERAATWRFHRGSTTNGGGLYRVIVGETIRVEKVEALRSVRWRRPVGGTLQ